MRRTEERLEVQAQEQDTLHEERDALEAEQRQARERASETGEKARLMEQESNRFKEELDARRELFGAVRERATSIKVQAATLKEQHEACLRGINDLQRQTRDIHHRMTSDGEERDKYNLQRQHLEQSLTELTGLLERLLRRQQTADSSCTGIRQAYENGRTELGLAENVAKQARETGDQTRQAQADLNLRFSTLTMQIEHLEQTLRSTHRIAPDDGLALLETSEFNETVLGGRQQELRRLLDEMGEVNLMAIDEYTAMEERFAFLSTQRDDLEESLRGLQQAIQRINRTTRQRFLETYNLVNAKFQEVFPRLFCGGKAELRLTNEDDLLETGIDIIVQPPGKKLQNVTLLSGGEKALTAVALIFSIFQIKPTPFCLLDEVDAPLDDANIGRFNEMVREMSEISQFIIITHNKATMQVADMLYGITMETPGSSKVVSVKLH